MTTLVDSTREQVPGPALRVVIVDDHRLLAQSVAVGLQLAGIECHVPEVRDSQSLLVELLDLEPTVVLLDLDLDHPGVETAGAELLAQLVAGVAHRVVRWGGGRP